MANVLNDLKTIMEQISRRSIFLPDAKSWDDQNKRINAVYKYVSELKDDEDDLK